MQATTILDHEELAADVAAFLQEDGRNCVVIEGPTASGKTALTELIAARLKGSFSARRAKGDRLERAVEEHALESGSSLPLRKDVAEYVADAAEDLGDLLSDDGVPFGKIAHRAINQVLAGGARGRLSETQQRFLARLLTTMMGKRPLLIADDLHYWDAVSLHFLRRILRGDLDPYYGRLKKLSLVIVVDRQRADRHNLELIDAVIGVAGGRRVVADYASAANYGEVLTALGLNVSLPDEQISTLHLLTGGNLALSRIVVEEIAAQGTTGAGDLPPPAIDSADFFLGVIARRLETVEGADQIKELVRLLAASGDDLSFDELACALKCPLETARSRASGAASQLNFISVSEGRLRLTHEVLQPLLAAALGESGREAHRILEACLSRLRPGDYGRRSAHSAASGEVERAQQLAIMERLSGMRQGRYAWSAPEPSPAEACTAVGAAARAFDSAYRAISQGDFTGALVALEGQDLDAPTPLRWEVTLLRAQILGEMNQDACVQRAVGLLEELDEAREAEIELWGRAKEMQVVALSNLRKPEEGRRLEATLRQTYQARAAYDPAAALALNRLRRRAEAVHSPQIANDRLNVALRFFSPESSSELPVYPAEYLATLNNLCANELLLGRFTAARAHARRAATTDFRLIEFVLRRPELVWSNVLLCELFNGKPPGPIADAYLGLAGGRDLHFVDGMLLEINVAAALAAAGRFEVAQRRLSDVQRTFQAQGEAQPYVAHFIAANLSSLAWIVGDDDAVPLAMAEAAAALERMRGHEYSAPFLEARSNCLAPVLNSRPRARTVAALQAAFDGPPKVGESWVFFARPFLATDIQFWSDT